MNANQSGCLVCFPFGNYKDGDRPPRGGLFIPVAEKLSVNMHVWNSSTFVNGRVLQPLYIKLDVVHVMHGDDDLASLNLGTDLQCMCSEKINFCLVTSIL